MGLIPFDGPEALAAPSQRSGARTAVDRADAEKGNPWWVGLLHFLLQLQPRTPAGIAADGGAVELVVLSGEAKRRLIQMVEAAPESELASHRTLRSVSRIASETDKGIEVRFFARAP